MTDRHATLRQGLVGAWCPSSQLGGARLIDRSPYGTNPALTGFPWSGIHAGAAINGNGTSSRGDIGDLSRFRLGDCTISAWMRAAAQGTANRCIFSTYSQNTAVAGISFGVNIAGTGQNTLSAVVGAGTGNSAFQYAIWNTTVNVCDSVLRCVAFTLSGTTGKIYVDGSEVTTTLGTGNTAVVPGYAAANYVNIGTEQTTSAARGKYFNGLLDDIRAYNRALTLSELKLLATQRGIGLVPTRHRRARLPTSTTTVWLNVGGVWKTTTPKINVGGTWKTATPKINVSGTWKG